MLKLPAAAGTVIALAGLLGPVCAAAQTSPGAASAEMSAGQPATGDRRLPRHRPGRNAAHQPASVRHQAVPPSQRLPEEPNQMKEQVAPVPDAPVKPGSGVAVKPDSPKTR